MNWSKYNGLWHGATDNSVPITSLPQTENYTSESGSYGAFCVGVPVFPGDAPSIDGATAIKVSADYSITFDREMSGLVFGVFIQSEFNNFLHEITPTVDGNTYSFSLSDEEIAIVPPLGDYDYTLSVGIGVNNNYGSTGTAVYGATITSGNLELYFNNGSDTETCFWKDTVSSTQVCE